MLLIHKDISHMPISELENDSESVRVKVFANKTSPFVASWYRPPGRNLAKLESQFMSFKSQLEKIKDIHKCNIPPLSSYSGGLQLQSYCLARQTQQIRFTNESI